MKICSKSQKKVRINIYKCKSPSSQLTRSSNFLTDFTHSRTWNTSCRSFWGWNYLVYERRGSATASPSLLCWGNSTRTLSLARRSFNLCSIHWYLCNIFTLATNTIYEQLIRRQRKPWLNMVTVGTTGNWLETKTGARICHWNTEGFHYLLPSKKTWQMLIICKSCANENEIQALCLCLHTLKVIKHIL